MYSKTVLTCLLASSLLLLPSAIATPLQRRGPTQEGFCTGRGIGLRSEDYREMINLIDINIDYTVPWDSTSLPSGRTKLPNDEVSMHVEKFGEDGGSVDGTITGLTLQYQLGLLNNMVNENQGVCSSADGTYYYGLGYGISST